MKAIKKDSIIQIKYTLKRFCSILLMALLGVGFFAGIKATSPDMENTLDSYFDENNVFDIQLVSTLGFTKKDIEAVEKIDGIESMYPTYSTDLEFEISEKNIIVKAFAYTENEINQFVLLEGNLPTEQGQCVVEEEFIQSSDLNIGDKITTKLEEDSILKEYTFEIVGIIQSPLFISRERGSSKLGDGIIDCYLYISQQSFEQDISTECYINIEETKQLNTFTQKYTDVIEEKKRLLEEVAKIREEERYQEILDEANAEKAENEKKLLDAKEEAERKLQEAESKIQRGEKQIVSAENAIYNNEITAQREFEDANAKIEEAQKTLQEKETQWADAKINLLEQISEGEDGIENIKNGIQTIEQVIIQIEEQYEGITDEELLKQKEEQIQKLTLEKTELEKQQKEIQSKLEIARQTITQTEEQLEQGKSEIENNKQELEKTKKTTYSRINEAKATIATQKKELEEAKMTLTEEREKAEKEIKEAEEKIISAKKDLEKLEKPTWYVLDRTSNTGYYSYKQDTQRIANIGKIFPIVFFIVATLISLTSMTRMVEEQRVQIGTLKALGYSNLQIAWKYIIYASAATIIGSVIGMSIGFILLPKIIFSMYQMMYTMPDIQLNFNWYYAVLGLAIASLCIVGATIYACYMELKNTPAELMRPRAPKPGKRVILEKIPFIWKNMNFTKKVTARNLFRYKKRFLMTIIGICGCTALILAGFGLKNSLGSMIPMQ